MSKKNSKNKSAKKAKKAPAKSKSKAKAKSKTKSSAKPKVKAKSKVKAKAKAKKGTPKTKAKKTASKTKVKAKPAKTKTKTVKAKAKAKSAAPKPKTAVKAKPKAKVQAKPASKPAPASKSKPVKPEALSGTEVPMPEPQVEDIQDETQEETPETPGMGKKSDKGAFHNAAKEYNPFLYDNLNKPKPMKAAPNPDERTRYSEEELKEFEVLIAEKLEAAKKELTYIKEVLSRKHDPGTDTTAGTLKLLEDGADTAEKENFTQLAARQQKFIQQLENAMARIKNGTYGICVETGKLIPKERLRAVPHTQHSIEAKLNRKD